MELKGAPELTGSRGVPGAGGLPALVVTGSPPLRWLRSFSSRRHLARLLLNHTCKHQKLFVIKDDTTNIKVSNSLVCGRFCEMLQQVFPTLLHQPHLLIIP